MAKNIQLSHPQITFKKKQLPLCVLADGLMLARNIGSLFRLSDAFGVEHIYLNRIPESLSDLKIRKAARSTQKTVSYRYVESEKELIKELKQTGYTLISLEITTESHNLRDFCTSHTNNENLHKICLIIGSEDKGICQTLLDISDYTVHIPMQGQNTSMNVVTASSIALYELSNLLAH